MSPEVSDRVRGWEIGKGSEGRPLHGIRVLDVSRILAGPHCTMILGDLGADVVKVEPPAGDETRRWGPPFFGETAAYYFATNRNKRSVALDLKSDRGRQDLLKLLGQADVLVHNFTADLAVRLHVDSKSVQIANPQCIHVTLSGYGPSQPNRRGYDLMAQALGGLMSVTGERGGRGLKVGVPIADLTAGTYAATAIVSALFDRAQSGRVARIEVSLIDSVTSLLANQAMNWLLCQSVPHPLGNDHPTVVPYGVFQTATEDMVVAVASDAQYRDLCMAIDRSDLGTDPRFITNAGRVGNRDELVASLNSHFISAGAASWITRLTNAGIPCGMVRTVPDAFASADVQNVATVESRSVGTIKQVLGPIRLNDRYLDPVLPPPMLDEHHGELLSQGDSSRA
jgi:crotonobetainyl-CoA:carnitine CoA-transferase CaiB-like acyl-CoA transferase